MCLVCVTCMLVEGGDGMTSGTILLDSNACATRDMVTAHTNTTTLTSALLVLELIAI